MASIPVVTASLRLRYSSGRMRGKSLPAPRGGPGWVALVEEWRRRGGFSVGGKDSHRLRDLRRTRHEELLLRGVERHRRNVRCGHSDYGPVQAVERVLGDDGCDLGPEAAGQVVLVHDHRLARLADGREDAVAVERRQGAQVDHLDTDPLRLERFGRLQAVV